MDAGPLPLDGMPAALRRVLGDGRAVVLTDGPDNSAYWEHDWTARALGVPLVTPDDLELRGERLLHDGEPVDASTGARTPTRSTPTSARC